ncbi:MAG: hypothetical protein ACK5XP_04975 [Sphingobacteriia bacterium]
MLRHLTIPCLLALLLPASYAQPLYRDCRNELNLDHPAPELRAYRLQAHTADGQLQPNPADDRSWQAVPLSNPFRLAVTQIQGDGMQVQDTLSWPVQLPPRPRFALTAGGRPVPMEEGKMKVNLQDEYVLCIQPDADFAQAYPQDAAYGMVSVTVVAVYSKKNQYETTWRLPSVQQLALQQLSQYHDPAEEKAPRYYEIRVTEVSRTNYAGQVLNSSQGMSTPLVLQPRD